MNSSFRTISVVSPIHGRRSVSICGSGTKKAQVSGDNQFRMSGENAKRIAPRRSDKQSDPPGSLLTFFFNSPSMPDRVPNSRDRRTNHAYQENGTLVPLRKQTRGRPGPEKPAQNHQVQRHRHHSRTERFQDLVRSIRGTESSG